MTRGVQDRLGTMRQAHLVSLIILNITFPMRSVTRLEEGAVFWTVNVTLFVITVTIMLERWIGCVQALSGEVG